MIEIYLDEENKIVHTSYIFIDFPKILQIPYQNNLIGKFVKGIRKCCIVN